jgi:predicted protein tyrosine phosphatase
MLSKQHSKPVIYVRSRLEAERVLPGPDEVCISITNPRQAPAVLDGWRDVLRLGFHDVEGPAGHYREMSVEHASQVLAFARKHRGRSMLISCEFGASRSAAVALFLASWLNRPLDGDDELANQWVLQTMAVAGRRAALRWMDPRLAAVSTWGPRGILCPMPFASTRNPLQD